MSCCPAAGAQAADLEPGRLMSWPGVSRSGESVSRAGETQVGQGFQRRLRTLYDILEQQQGGRGWLELPELESCWPDSGSGLVPCLRRAAGPGGRITFPRLLAAVRRAMGEGPEPGAGEPALDSPQTRPGAQGTGHPALDSPQPATLERGEGRAVSRSHSITGSVARAAQRRSDPCRGEPRRHTITGGVDYDLLKQMKELERERDALLHGLEVVDRTRVWYLQQIHGVKGRQDQVKRGFGDTDRTVDSRPNRACLLLAKIQEVNSCLSDLISTPGQTLYIHHPANVLPGKVTGIHRQSIGTLQEHNRLLTKELSVKSGRITTLERERTALIKRLMEAQNNGFSESSCEGSTII